MNIVEARVPNGETKVLLQARNIAKIYTDSAVPVEVLRGLDLDLKAGEVAGIFGASGSGKSTLLHILGGLDAPTEGDVVFEGVDIRSLGSDELAGFRNRKVGFVFQFYHLLSEFTAVENVMLPALIAGMPRRQAHELACQALEEMGLIDRENHRPAILSGGEQQRVALARAAVLKPPVILADEPTGNLDQKSGERVWQYLLNLNQRHGVAIIVVTHNRDLMLELLNTYELRDKKLHLIKGLA
jgi:lipoprotein-releasing system ATP-binding protein